MSSRRVDELELGMAAEITRTYDEWDIYAFAAVTGDLNPAHVDEAWAARTVFKGRIAHGMLTASLISATLGTKLPGPGTIYLAQDLKFLRPVRAGDAVTARVAVIELDRDRNLATLMTVCTNERGERLLEGTALVKPPRSRPAEPAPLAEVPRRRLSPRPAAPPRPRGPRGRGSLVEQRMTPDPVTIGPDATAAEAQELLHQHGIRHLPVVDQGRLVGIVSDRDLRRASLPGAGPGPDPMLDLVRVEDVMTTEVATVAPDDHIGRACRLFVERKIGALPVVDEGRLLGILTVIDALEAALDLVEG